MREKQENSTNKTHRNISRTTYLFILIVMLTSISMVTAFEFDNIKGELIKDETTSEYGKIEIRNSIFGIPWLQLDKVMSAELKTNTEQCPIEGCNANQEIIMYEDGKLIDDKGIRFIDLRTGKETNIKNYQIKYKIDGKWTNYSFEEVLGDSKGIKYEVILKGELFPFQEVDWQIKIGGTRWIIVWARWTQSLNTDLLAYYPFEEGTGTETNSTNDGLNNLTLVNSPNWTSGKIGNALNFTDQHESFLVNESAMENIFAFPLTFNAWIKPNETASGTQHIVSYAVNISNSAPGKHMYLRVEGGGKLEGQFHISNGTEVITESAAGLIQLDKWQMVTWILNESTQQVYINGTMYKESEWNLNGNLTSDQITQYRNFTIGRRGEGNFGGFNGTIDEVSIHNRTLTQAEITFIYNGGAGITWIELDPIVNLISPANNFNTVNTSLTFEANHSSTVTLTNTTLYVWESDGSLFGINTTTITGTTNQTNLSISSFTIADNYTWNFFTCAATSPDICNWDENGNRTFNISGIVVDNQAFNNITTEGARETFSINFTKASGFQVSMVVLVYNGTLNSFPYSVSGDNVISESSIVIPAQTSDVNVSFYWNITLNGGLFITTSSNNQTIQTINIDNCDSFTNLIYNFTQKDEANKTTLTTNTTMDVQVNLYDTLKTLLLVNFSQTFNQENPAQVCLEDSLLTTVNYSSYVVVKYFANLTGSVNNSYAIEYHNILNQTIGNGTVPKDIALYNLKEVDATKFRLTFRDGNYILAPSVLVNVYRQYVEDNDFKIVEIPLTDNDGQTILNLVRNNIIYNFIMVNEAGNVVATFNSVTAFCQDFTIGQCTINLAADSNVSEVYDYNEEFNILISNLSYNNVTELISIEFITGDLQPKEVRIEVIRNNDFGNRSVCSNSLIAASGTLRCNASSVTDTDQFLFTQIYVEGDLATQDTINLNASILNFGIVNGAFYAFLLILLIITLFTDDRKMLVISLGLGWLVVISLGLINGKLIGAASAGIWILVSIAIFLWKLNKEDSP